MHNIFEHGPLAEMDMEHRRALSGLASKIAYHIQDNDVHLTEKEKAAVKKLVEDSQTTQQVDIDLSEYAKKSSIPTKVSQLENDKGYITEIGDQFMTKAEAESYINKILSGLDITTVAQLNNAIKDLQSQIDGKCTIDQVNTLIVEKLGAINNTLTIHDKQILNLENEIANLKEGGTFTLEPATATKLGGIKVGKNLTITADGTLNADASGSGSGSSTGTSQYTDFRFKRSNSTPPRPTDSTATGWSDSVPVGTEDVWMISRVVTIINDKETYGQWSTPQRMSTTASFICLYSSRQDKPSDPPTPTKPTGTECMNDSTYVQNCRNAGWSWTTTDPYWMATSTCNGGVWDSWVVSKIKGEDGKDGTGINIHGEINGASDGYNLNSTNLNTTHDTWSLVKGSTITKTDNTTEIPQVGYCYKIKGGELNGHIIILADNSPQYQWVDLGIIQGDSAYVHIKFTDDARVIDSNTSHDINITLLETPAKYMGIYTDNKETDSNNWYDYKWGLNSGKDGFSYQYIYTATYDSTKPKAPAYQKGQIDASDEGDNSFTDENGVTWYDDQMDVSPTNKYIWRCWVKTDQVNGTWNGPTLIANYGEPGSVTGIMRSVIINDNITIETDSNDHPVGDFSGFSTGNNCTYYCLVKIFNGTEDITATVYKDVIVRNYPSGTTAAGFYLEESNGDDYRKLDENGYIKFGVICLNQNTYQLTEIHSAEIIYQNQVLGVITMKPSKGQAVYELNITPDVIYDKDKDEDSSQINVAIYKVSNGVRTLADDSEINKVLWITYSNGDIDTNVLYNSRQYDINLDKSQVRPYTYTFKLQKGNDILDIEKVSVFPMYNDKYVVEIIPTYRNFSKSIKQSDFGNTIKLPSVSPDGTIIAYNEWTTNLTNINLSASAPVLWRVDIYKYSNDTYAIPNPPFVAQIFGNGIGLASGKYTYRSYYLNSESYHNDNQQIDYVAYGTTVIDGNPYFQYYVRKGPEGVCTGIDPTNTEYWQPFAEFVALGAQFITADQIKARLVDTHKLTADNIDTTDLSAENIYAVDSQKSVIAGISAKTAFIENNAGGPILWVDPSGAHSITDLENSQDPGTVVLNGSPVLYISSDGKIISKSSDIRSEINNGQISTYYKNMYYPVIEIGKTTNDDDLTSGIYIKSIKNLNGVFEFGDTRTLIDGKSITLEYAGRGASTYLTPDEVQCQTINCYNITTSLSLTANDKILFKNLYTLDQLIKQYGNASKIPVGTVFTGENESTNGRKVAKLYVVKQ